MKRLAGAAAILSAIVAVGGCERTQGLSSASDTRRSGHELAGSSSATIIPEPTPIRFRNVASAMGLDYVWPAQPKPMRQVEAFGSGCAFLDFDRDGWQDILCVGDPHVSLFRNAEGRGFEDVTASSGLTAPQGDWTGCAVGDTDGDGWLDLLVTGYHQLAFFRNTGDGRFQELTTLCGFDPANRGHWGASAGFMDLDGDGDLDLVLLNYVIFGPHVRQYCEIRPGVLSGCAPNTYSPEYGDILRNDGSGRFELVPDTAGMKDTNGWALVVAFADLDDDGRQDFYIGNDGAPADLLHNLGNMQFENIGELSGLARNDLEALAAMGADWADYDRNGLLDLCVTAFSKQSYAVFQNQGDLFFNSAGDALGISLPTFLPLGFGAKWLDMDNDGWADLTFVNGHVYERTAEMDEGTTYRQPMMLFHNQQGKTFRDLTPVLGGDVARPLVGRGSATGDFDNDGRVDLLVVDYEGPVMLLQNQTETANHWIKLDLRSDPPNAFAYGAKVTAHAGGEVWVQEVSPASSYLSSSDPRIHWGLGPVEQLETLRIRWPSGREEVFQDLAADRLLTFYEGQGIIDSRGPSPPAKVAP
jgi:hypothetical protein